MVVIHSDWAIVDARFRMSNFKTFLYSIGDCYFA